jgi:hypothetical protein
MDSSSFLAIGVAAILAIAGASLADDPVPCAGIPSDAETRELPVRPGYPYDRAVGYFIPNPLLKGKPGGDTLYPKTLLVAARCYFPNGKLCKETCYFTDPRTNASVEDGLRREWFPNGQLCSERSYQKGLLHGVCKQWSPNGKLLGRFEMKEGTGIETVWWDNGQLRSERETLDDKRDGRSRFFSDRGMLIEELWYRQGALHGPARHFDGPVSPTEPAVRYYLRGERVSQQDYLAARKDDPKLPPPVEP